MQRYKYYSATIYAATLLNRRHFSVNFCEKTTTKIIQIFSSSTSKAYYATNGSNNPDPLDLYAVLGVDKTATAKDIKAAYYDLSKKYHPDAAGGFSGKDETSDARRFHQITDAYEILSNEDKRRVYDSERARSAASRNYDDGGGFVDPDLQTLREYQRKWNLRRQHYNNRDQAYRRMRDEFEMKQEDKEEFESFYKRYRENLAKARRWDESSTPQRHGGREELSRYQKDMLRKQHAKQMEQNTLARIFTTVAVVTAIVLLAIRW